MAIKTITVNEPHLKFLEDTIKAIPIRRFCDVFEEHGTCAELYVDESEFRKQIGRIFKSWRDLHGSQ